LIDARIGCVFATRGMEDFFIAIKDLLDNYEDELEEIGLFET